MHQERMSSLEGRTIDQALQELNSRCGDLQHELGALEEERRTILAQLHRYRAASVAGVLVMRDHRALTDARPHRRLRQKLEAAGLASAITAPDERALDDLIEALEQQRQQEQEQGQ